MNRILIVDNPDNTDVLSWMKRIECESNLTFKELPIPTDPEIKQMADDYASQMIDENMIRGWARKDYIAGANAIINLLK